jgi:hypothetical protein
MEPLRYYAKLIRTLVERPGPRERTGRIERAVVAGLVAVLAFATTVGSRTAPEPADVTLAGLVERAVDVRTHFGAIEEDWAREVEPIERVLLAQRDDADLARRVATALVREGRQTGVEPKLLLAVLLVENQRLDPHAVSTAGARGLMQVMPFHAGQWEPCAPRLDDVEANICHGARIFAHYLGATNGDIDRALLRYNGCVAGTNTPDCHRYPSAVFARAGRASLASWRPGVGAAASR